MSHCRCCNRLLKREPYVSEGIGPLCKLKQRLEVEKASNEADQDIIEPYDGGDIYVKRENGKIRTNVQRTVYKASPTGFEFGYGGSGPADLALNLLLMLTTNEEAYERYQEFKWKFIATGNEKNTLEIKREKIFDWLQLQRINNETK